MARRHELAERRAAIAVERGDIAEYLAKMDLAAQDEESELRWKEKIDRNAVLSKEDGKLAQLETIEAATADAERRAQGKPIGGGGPAPIEVRVFGGGPTAAPAGFDGMILRTQSGDRVPVLERRHSLAAWAPASETRAAELGLGGFLRALYNGPSTELERRVLAEGSIGTGGAMVPTPLAAEVIDLLRARSVAFQAGARTIPMDSATLRFARIIGDPVAGWRAENAAITESDPTFDTVTLQAKTDALLCRVSRELLEDGQNLDAQLRSVFASAMALSLDKAILFGTGTANQPLGVANTPGIQSVSMGPNGFALQGWAKPLDAASTLETANAGAISAIVASPRTARAVYGLVDTSGQPLTMPPRLAGIPFLVTSAVPINETQGTSSIASSMLLGDWSEVFVGIRTALQISILQERYADTGQVGFVAWLRADVAVARPAAMARIVGIVP